MPAAASDRKRRRSVRRDEHAMHIAYSLFGAMFLSACEP